MGVRNAAVRNKPLKSFEHCNGQLMRASIFPLRKNSFIIKPYTQKKN